MKIKDLASFKKDQLQTLLGRIPFFREIQTSSEQQLQVLLRHSCVVELEPGEVIMRRGDRGAWLYFLIKGRLSVFWDDITEQPLSTITPGELFGDLALLCNHERKATVAAAQGEKKALLFATDFKPFGDLENFSVVDVATKLTFYRTMVHSIRWRLEVNRMQDPVHHLAQSLRQVPIHSGARGGEEELRSLYQQAQYLADILDRWNSGEGVAQGEVVQDVVVATAAQN